MMMQGLRKAGQTWLGKVLVALLFGFLIFSFAIWGIGDIFRGGGRADQVVVVGKTIVTTDALRNSFQQELQRLSRQVRRNVTPEQARAFGVDQQVLARLTSEATLDEATQRLNINVPDSLVAESILTAPEFQNASGVFSRTIFDEILRNNGLNEAGFFTEQKRSLARVFLGDALTAHTHQFQSHHLRQCIVMALKDAALTTLCLALRKLAKRLIQPLSSFRLFSTRTKYVLKRLNIAL